jgi:hypothetical protein
MAKTSEAADKPAALIALNDKTRSDVDEAIRKLRELDGKEVELWQWWAVVCMALWKAYQLGAATTQPTHEQAKAEMAKAEQAVPVAWRTDAPASEDEQGRQLDLAREDQRLFGHGVTVNGWRVPAPLVSLQRLRRLLDREQSWRRTRGLGTKRQDCARRPRHHGWHHRAGEGAEP